MCDEKQLKLWATEALSRRQFGVIAGAGAISACAPTGSQAGNAAAAAAKLTERSVTFTTPDGTMDAFFVHPASGKHPAVILWPDIASIREAKRNMARRLAGEGYAVLVLNPYYRDVAGEQFTDFADFAGNGGWQKVGPWRGRLNADTVSSDAKAAVAWLDAQAPVDTGKGIGTQGYCMGGPFTIWTAAAVPARVRAAASFHGGGLVREDYDKSPHKLLEVVQAGLLIAVAKNDDAKDPQSKVTFAETAKTAGVTAKVEVYEGDHGWTVPDSPAYAEAAAEQAYADWLALYSANLTFD
jgi:carboxymethylenebutenolidase